MKALLLALACSASMADICPCARRLYTPQLQCIMCPAGQWAPCEGPCRTCTNCTQHLASPCTPMSDAVCSACPSGKYLPQDALPLFSPFGNTFQLDLSHLV